MKPNVCYSILAALLLAVACIIFCCGEDKSPTEPNGNKTGFICAGTYRQGVFRSLNGGENWTAINNGLTELRVYSLAINSKGDLFAGTDDSGVFRSTNQGDAWTHINSGLSGTVRMVAINSTNNHIFAGTSGGLVRSTNNGDNWALTGFTGDVDRVAINSSGQIFVGTELDGIFRSADDGNNWKQVLTGDFGPVMSLAFNASGHVFAGTFVVFRSTDNGENWTMLSNGPKNAYISPLAVKTNDHIFAGAFFPGDPPELFRSTDNGESWTDVANGLPHFVLSIAFDSNGGVLAGLADMGEDGISDGSGGGIYRSTNNGTSWTLVGLAEMQIMAVIINSL